MADGGSLIPYCTSGVEARPMQRLLPLLLLLGPSPAAALRRHASSDESLLRRDAEDIIDGEYADVPYCTEVKERSVSYICDRFRLGNRFMQYWNARAYAFLNQQDFTLKSNRTDMVSHFRERVPAAEPPSSMQSRLWETMQTDVEDRANCINDCPFPVGRPYGPWRLIGDTMLHETVDAVRRVISVSADRLKRRTNWTKRQSWAVLHFRCDNTIWKNEQYGFMRHAFIRDRLPNTTTHMLIVGQVHNLDKLCVDIMVDLVKWLKEDRKLMVDFQQTDIEDDWLTLATAPLLFCSISTFCLSAGLGNPNTVYFPYSGKNMVVAADGKKIKEASALRSPGFHWVNHDYLPGPIAFDRKWEDVQDYFHADACNEAVHGCVPVGGRIPKKYLFHQQKWKLEE